MVKRDKTSRYLELDQYEGTSQRLAWLCETRLDNQLKRMFIFKKVSGIRRA